MACRMSLFFSTHTITLEKHIVGATNAALLDLLHDPLQVLRLSPLVYKVEQDATDPAWYTITERLPLLGGMLTTSTTFRCRYRETEDGCECEVLAGLGTRLTSSMFGHAADDGERKGGVVYTERLAVKGLFFLMPFIKRTMTNAHVAMMDVVEAKLLKKD